MGERADWAYDLETELRALGLPIAQISCCAYDAFMGLVTLNNSGFAKPKDLEGKKLASTTTSGEYPFIPAFAEKAERINEYLKNWGAVGFRSGFMLHNLDWLGDLNALYDASTFDTDVFYAAKGQFMGREMSVTEMKTIQHAWAVKRVERVFRQAWDEAHQPAK